MKTYTCTTCDKTFEGKSALRDHEKYDSDHRIKTREAIEAQRAVDERKNKLESARQCWDDCHRPGVTNKTWGDGLPSGFEKKTWFALCHENDELANDVRKLAEDARYMQERITRDLIEPIAKRGAKAFYSGELNGSAIIDLARMEGRIAARRDCLRDFANALGVRCQATVEPFEWAFQVSVSELSVVEQDGQVMLDHVGFGRLEGFFTTVDEAKEAGIERVRQVVIANEQAMAKK